jgi:hypothetical protein
VDLIEGENLGHQKARPVALPDGFVQAPARNGLPVKHRLHRQGQALQLRGEEGNGRLVLLLGDVKEHRRRIFHVCVPQVMQPPHAVAVVDENDAPV